MEFSRIDEKRELLIAETVDLAMTMTAIRFISIAEQAIAEHGSFSVALSGGSTPKLLFEKLLDPEQAAKINWSKVRIFWSDERAVPADHPESNYAMAMHYFSKEPLDEAKKFRMPADELDLGQEKGKEKEKAASDYERQIQKHTFEGRFDLMLLGIGEDAHTASLFPGTQALHVTDRLVVPNFVPQKDCWRMTVTFRCINESRKIIVLAFGKSKAHALQMTLQGKENVEKYPAQGIGQGSTGVLFVVDKEAASALK